ncbi:hypothetical protein Tco_0940162 [Tanacetum coccineum]|uniref:Uncharacterized protein n=1 Tax=Tanacetum coccineum TaxID=301880 RepID=A0ABQ5DN01_9ASTR
MFQEKSLCDEISDYMMQDTSAGPTYTLLDLEGRVNMLAEDTMIVKFDDPSAVQLYFLDHNVEEINPLSSLFYSCLKAPRPHVYHRRSSSADISSAPHPSYSSASHIHPDHAPSYPSCSHPFIDATHYSGTHRRILPIPALSLSPYFLYYSYHASTGPPALESRDMMLKSLIFVTPRRHSTWSRIEYTLYDVSFDEEIEEPIKDQPLPADASPTALSSGYIANSEPEEDEEDPEEDPADYPAYRGDNYNNESSDDDDDDNDVEKDEEDEEEEEHLALADPSVVPTDDPVPLS